MLHNTVFKLKILVEYSTIADVDAVDNIYTPDVTSSVGSLLNTTAAITDAVSNTDTADLGVFRTAGVAAIAGFICSPIDSDVATWALSAPVSQLIPMIYSFFCSLL
jgi:hypothetical protein